MGSIPLPALDIKTPQVESPIDQYAKVLNLKNIMQRAQLGDIQLQQGQMELQQGQQQQKDLQLFSKAYIASNGDSVAAKDTFLRSGGSLAFWQKIEDAHNEAVSKEEDRQRKLTADQRLADQAKRERSEVRCLRSATCRTRNCNANSSTKQRRV